MGRSQETFSKKEKEKKRIQARKDKEEKKQERQANAKKGQNLEDMLAYIDENGNLSATPPDPRRKIVIKSEDIQIAIPKQEDIVPEDLIRTGIVTLFNESKGYGFIRDLQTQESIFVHAKFLNEPIRENNKVTFEIQMGPKGPTAVDVKKTS